ncbi:hypothetical protein ABIF66_001576 [Bradyrhizobium japonicum]
MDYDCCAVSYAYGDGPYAYTPRYTPLDQTTAVPELCGKLGDDGMR